ncbi:MAG TPA: formyltransferase family protein [Ignavibacteria bacterium]|nr:formyltransferase family protein [Ignavibacteria bacterium]
MSKKNVVILGGSPLALEIGKQILVSKKLNLYGYVKEKDKDKLQGFSDYDLGTDINILSKLNPDISIALDYHKIIPAEIISSFKIINSHGGLLPENRGYHTLGWGFINDHNELGYTLHLMDEGLDSGDVIYTFRYPVKRNTTFSELKNAVDLDQRKNIVKVLCDFTYGKIKSKPQRIKFPKYYSKRNLSDCMIDWNNKSAFIERFIRALSVPAGPGAFTIYDAKRMTILNAELYPCKDYLEIPGHVVYKTNDKILVKTKDKCLWIEDVIYEGNKLKAGKLIRKSGVRLGLNFTEEILKLNKII